MIVDSIEDLTDEALAKARSIAVDVDGTLVHWDNPRGKGDPGGNCTPNGALIEKLIQWKKGNLDRELTVWSGMGREHATRMVAHLNLLGVVNHIMSKPTFMFDDHTGWFDDSCHMVDVKPMW